MTRKRISKIPGEERPSYKIQLYPEAMSKPFPKMLQDLKESERKSPGAAQLVVGKNGNVIATTLRNQVVEKEQKK